MVNLNKTSTVETGSPVTDDTIIAEILYALRVNS